MWPRKRIPKPSPEKDVEEAREMRAIATAELKTLHQQDHYVDSLATRLIERRALNGFGDDVQISFTRRHA